MPRSINWTNPDGLIVSGGRRTTDDTVPAVTTSANGVKTMVVRITAASLIASSTAWTAGDVPPQSVVMKRGSRIQTATFVTKTPFDNITALIVGTWGVVTREYPTAAAVDVLNGIISATEGVLANLTPAGKVITGNGALIATASNVGAVVGTTSNSDVVVSWVHSGSTAPTVGDGVLTITYVEPQLTSIEG